MNSANPSGVCEAFRPRDRPDFPPSLKRWCPKSVTGPKLTRASVRDATSPEGAPPVGKTGGAGVVECYPGPTGRGVPVPDHQMLTRVHLATHYVVWPSGLRASPWFSGSSACVRVPRRERQRKRRHMARHLPTTLEAIQARLREIERRFASPQFTPAEDLDTALEYAELERLLAEWVAASQRH